MADKNDKATADGAADPEGDEAAFRRMVEEIGDELNELVFPALAEALQAVPRLRSRLSPAFPFPQKLRVGVTSTHLCVEFVGPEDPNDPSFDVEGVWAPDGTVLDFLGVDLSATRVPMPIPHPHPLENMRFFLGDSMTMLGDYMYDVVANPSDLMLNGFLDFTANRQEPTFVSNTAFLWSDADGAIRVRHVDFMELIPIVEQEDGRVGWGYRTRESMRDDMVPFLLHYEVPRYDVALHRTLNAFIELVHAADATEPRITKYLSEHPEILQLAFGCDALNPQTLLEWQYETDKDNLQPDFMPVKMDGFADILEFKLPWLGGKPVVGTPTRTKPSAEVDAALAQIDEYAEWCDDEVNRRWLEEDKGIRVYAPMTYLVIGHRKDLSAEDRQRFRKRRNAIIYTYDEFVEMTRMNLYRAR